MNRHYLLMSFALLLHAFGSADFAMAGVDSGFPGKGYTVQTLILPEVQFAPLALEISKQPNHPVTLPEIPGDTLVPVIVDLHGRLISLRSLSRENFALILKSTDAGLKLRDKLDSSLFHTIDHSHTELSPDALITPQD